MGMTVLFEINSVLFDLELVLCGCYETISHSCYLSLCVLVTFGSLLLFSQLLVQFYACIMTERFYHMQAMYNEFSTANIQIDKDFSAKLSGYGCVGHIPETEEISTNSVVS